MLVRIEEIAGIGLLHDVHPAAHKFEKAALIYAGNGRGKTTLSNIFRSVSTGDAERIDERKTIDGTLSPKVVLQMDSGHKVAFDAGSWSEIRPEFLVFDTAFIEENVYSGGDVTSDQRKNLFDFAVGDRAVKALKAESDAVSSQQAASAKIKSLSDQLTIHAGGIPLPVFRAMKLDPDAAAAQTRLERARADGLRAASIAAQPLPAELTVISLDLDAVFGVLGSTLHNVHAEAELLVAEHLDKLPGSNASVWLSAGAEFDDHATCPYCGQTTGALPLLRAYQSHFDEAYVALKDRIAATGASISHAISDGLIAELAAQRKTSNDRLSTWSSFVDLDLIADDLDELAASTLGNLRDLLLSLLSRKALAPAEPLGGEERAEAFRLWEQFTGLYRDQNLVIASYIAAIEAYKTGLLSQDLASIESQLASSKLGTSRHSAPVVALVAELQLAELELKAAETTKRHARAGLSSLMTTTLDQYRADINAHLTKLGAAFSIDEIKTNFLGQAPRTDYGLTLRGKAVKLSGGRPTFATALSEGDKRTLAFAFFAASTIADPDLSNKVVVIDDPVSSLDRPRREHTTRILVEIAARAGQLILLAHDATFLRDTQRALAKSQSAVALSTMQIARTQHDYSTFSAVDLDRECETPYYSNYRAVDEFVAGKTTDARTAATALRPLLEGYLHKKYPGRIPQELTLGHVIAHIEQATSPSPLTLAHPKIQELRELNDFAGKFHHDTNSGYMTDPIDDAAVATFGGRLLALLHTV